MSTWADRAKAAILQSDLGGTAKTDETPIFGLSSVLAVPSTPVFQKYDVPTVRSIPAQLSNHLDIGTVRPLNLPPILLAASITLDASITALFKSKAA